MAAENVWGDIAGQLGGSRVRVTSILSDPGADPHLYQSDTHDAGAVARARLVVVNGAGYDPFMTRLLGATPSRAREVVTVATIVHAGGGDPNPHFWYDEGRARDVAAAIEAALARADPAEAGTFQANLARFDAALQPVLDTIALIKQRHAGTPVAYTERVPGYLLAAAGLDVRTPPGFARAVEDGSEPSPADAQAMTALVSSRVVKVLVYNAQATSPVTARLRTLARQAGVPVVVMTETLPPTEHDYETWQLGQARALLDALDG